jgi:hypothetical protein
LAAYFFASFLRAKPGAPRAPLSPTGTKPASGPGKMMGSLEGWRVKVHRQTHLLLAAASSMNEAEGAKGLVASMYSGCVLTSRARVQNKSQDIKYVAVC